MKLVTYNIHKGFSAWGNKLVIHEMRSALHELDPDMIFLQEVTGENRKHRSRYVHWPELAQHEFFAGTRWRHSRYSETRSHSAGHYGNAILSKYPILESAAFDLTAIPFEYRTMLYCEIRDPAWRTSLHCLCVHLSLLKRGRMRQFEMIRRIVDQLVPAAEPLVIAGDFNDWRAHACDAMGSPLRLREVFSEVNGLACAHSFPAHRPFLRLDRIYTRGLRIETALVHSGPTWQRLSDHAPISAEVEFQVGFGDLLGQGPHGLARKKLAQQDSGGLG